MTELERLEAASPSKYAHGVRDWQRVATKALETPGELTQLDLAIIGYFGGEKDRAEADAARRKALFPPVPAPPPAPKPAAARRPQPTFKTAEAYLAAFNAAYTKFETDAKSLSADDWALLSAKVPQWEFHGARLFMEAMNQKNEERNARIKALEARVLELEAQRAASVMS